MSQAWGGNMKAFLSHSSKDKDFVRPIYEILGESQCEYDERTFGYELNVRAIRDALERTDLFVYFLSSQSVTSTFVSEEQRTALELRGKGFIKRVVIFALDDTSYRALPDWMRDINVVQRLSSPKACARKIQAALVRLEAEHDSGSEIYIGRDVEDAALRKALSGAPAKTPLVVHAVGHYGVGRKTFVKVNLKKLFPRRFSSFVEITLAANQGIEEMYRQLYDLTSASSIEETVSDFHLFSTFPEQQQIVNIASMIQMLASDEEFLILIDDGGVYVDAGDYQPHLKSIIDALEARGIPLFAIIQTRMMPTKLKQVNIRSYHQCLSVLSDDDTRQLLGLTLKQVDVEYTDEQISTICEQIDGHPFNVRFAAAFAHDYGIGTLIADPSDLIEWKRKRAEDFLQTMTFSETEADILAALEEYRYLATEMIFAVVPGQSADVIAALRRLQEFSCVERREDYCHIAPPIRDAIRRNNQFQRTDAWKHKLGRLICEAIAEYQDSDQANVAILDTATLAAARGNSAPAYLSTLILPSHLLTIARDYYDDGHPGDCITLCERIWEARARLPLEAHLEVLRLWGLSAVRVDNEDAYDRVISLFGQYTGNTAERLRLFAEGFYLRVHKRLDEAEKKFVAAWKLSKHNQSVNRELANLLCKQRRYGEAEVYARQAYEQAPTNPFLIDVMAETLIGKEQQGLAIDRKELAAVMRALERYGDAPGSSFYLVRKAQSELANHDYRGALATSNRAVERTPGLINGYFIRADAQIALNNIPGAESDIAEINKLLTRAGGFSAGEEARLQELEIRILIEKGLLRQAKETTDRSAWLSHKVAERLRTSIAYTIAYDPTKADDDLRKWAAKRTAGKSGGRTKHP